MEQWSAQLRQLTRYYISILTSNRKDRQRMGESTSLDMVLYN